MTVVGSSRATSIHRRMCVRCGYDGRGVRDGVFRQNDPWCPNCGCDFRRRPPQSYAEMEGLYDEPYISIAPITPSPRRVRRSRRDFLERLEKCLAAIFVLLVSVVVVGQMVFLGWTAFN